VSTDELDLEEVIHDPEAREALGVGTLADVPKASADLLGPAGPGEGRKLETDTHGDPPRRRGPKTRRYTGAAMKSFKVDDVELEVGHDPGQNETSLAARDATGRVVLEFRCSYTEGSCRVDAAGGAREVAAPASEDPLEWILRMASGAARELLPVYPSREALAPIRTDIERALRNPPFDFESVTPERRRPSHGEKWTTYPEDVLPLWVADMDLPVAEPVRRLLARAVLRSDIGYPIHPAPTELPELTVARMEERFGWSPDAKRVEILTDVVQGMYVAVHQFTEPGDGIVVQTPIYPPFLNAASYEGRRRIEAPLVEEGLHYRVDLDALAAAIDDGTRVILLCNPHNPTGRVFTRDELEGRHRARSRGGER
jgi:hypothetical protein